MNSNNFFLQGHFFDGACTMTAIDESTGKLMSISEWKVKFPTEQKKVYFSNEETSDAIAKQVNLFYIIL